MNRIHRSILLISLFLSVSILINCNDPLPSFDVENIEGMIPIYDTDLTIEKLEARTINNPGKILSYGDLLFVNDVNLGIHVVNNLDPANPENLFFIRIPSNRDMAIYDNVLYVDNGPDLVGLTVSEDNFIVASRVSFVFGEDSEGKFYPPQNNVYFQCIDAERGAVVGWRRDVIAKPDCYKQNES